MINELINQTYEHSNHLSQSRHLLAKQAIEQERQYTASLLYLA